jgi:acetylornithine/N-succinyldiaminopimelate aminotransferase
MADTNELLALAGRHLLKTYKQPPLVMTRGEGCRLFDTEGRSYLDLYAGIAVCVLGHAHPALVRALTEQASRLGHIANLYYNDRQIELAARLSARTGMDRVFFTNSGTEANEGALKLARRWFFTQNDPERTDIVATWSSFHGRTMGSVAMTGTPKYWEGFGQRLPGVSQVKYGDLAAMRRRVNDRTAAIIIEPVQGEGGVVPAPPGYLEGLRAICDETGALLIVDEIQTGVGRSGRYLAVQHEGVRPDVLTLAKGLAGGVPIGAFLVRERYAEALAPGTHGSTFGGNPLACAAALAVLDTLEREGLIEGAASKGAHLLRGLEGLAAKHPALVKGARGRGLLCGLVLAEHVEAREVLVALRDRGVLVAQAGDRVLRFAPPLIITEAELDEGVAALDALLSAMPTEAA